MKTFELTLLNLDDEDKLLFFCEDDTKTDDDFRDDVKAILKNELSKDNDSFTDNKDPRFITGYHLFCYIEEKLLEMGYKQFEVNGRLVFDDGIIYGDSEKWVEFMGKENSKAIIGHNNKVWKLHNKNR